MQGSNIIYTTFMSQLHPMPDAISVVRGVAGHLSHAHSS
jgi:hypothetical protein